MSELSSTFASVVAIFMNYPWFGNVRELKNVIKRAALLSDGDYIVATSLPFEVSTIIERTESVP